MKTEVKERSIVSDFIVRVFESFFPVNTYGNNNKEKNK